MIINKTGLINGLDLDREIVNILSINIDNNIKPENIIEFQEDLSAENIMSIIGNAQVFLDNKNLNNNRFIIFSHKTKEVLNECGLLNFNSSTNSYKYGDRIQIFSTNKINDNTVLGFTDEALDIKILGIGNNFSIQVKIDLDLCVKLTNI